PRRLRAALPALVLVPAAPEAAAEPTAADPAPRRRRRRSGDPRGADQPRRATPSRPWIPGRRADGSGLAATVAKPGFGLPQLLSPCRRRPIGCRPLPPGPSVRRLLAPKCTDPPSLLPAKRRRGPGR